MDNCEKTLLGMFIGITVVLSIKIAYEYGRYTAVHEIYKRGWSVVINETTEEKSDNN